MPAFTYKTIQDIQPSLNDCHTPQEKAAYWLLNAAIGAMLDCNILPSVGYAISDYDQREIKERRVA